MRARADERAIRNLIPPYAEGDLQRSGSRRRTKSQFTAAIDDHRNNGRQLPIGMHGHRNNDLLRGRILRRRLGWFATSGGGGAFATPRGRRRTATRHRPGRRTGRRRAATGFGAPNRLRRAARRSFARAAINAGTSRPERRQDCQRNRRQAQNEPMGESRFAQGVHTFIFAGSAK